MHTNRSGRMGRPAPVAEAAQVVAPRAECCDSGRLVLAPYTAWVIGYDVPWAMQLWRLNRKPHAEHRARSRLAL